MIAISVKSNKIESAVSPLFGKAKWFALVDENHTITFWKNESGSGRVVADYFIAQGVTQVVVQHIGENPFKMLEQKGIRSYYAGKERILLKDAIASLKAGELEQVTDQNIAQFANHSHSHTHDHHHEHDNHSC